MTIKPSLPSKKLPDSIDPGVFSFDFPGKRIYSKNAMQYVST